MTAPAGQGVLQHGSLGQDEVLATVQMEYQSKQLQVILLVDTGHDTDMSMSEYTAAQLGLPFDDEVVQLEMGQSHTGQGQCR